MKIILSENSNSGYLSWKRKNVTIRGVAEVGEENGAGAMLGRGLYTAFLSNKALAKQYGQVHFVVNAIPKKPKVFNSLNEWEIWFYNTLVFKYSKENGKDYPDKRDFNANTTIEDEMEKLGYDGIIIKGREMVNYKPENVLYFKDENQLRNYYNFMENKPLNEQVNRIKKIMGLNEGVSDIVYHFTSMRSLYNIFNTNRFMLTLTLGSKTDTKLNKGKFYYMSTTRSKSQGYKEGDVKLVLDGKALNQTQKGTQVDYWGYSKDRDNYTSNYDYLMAMNSNEMEDRIISDKGYIDNAIKYIKEIHLYNNIEFRREMYDYIISKAKEYNIPVYQYNDRNAFLYQDKRKQITFDDIKFFDDNDKPYVGRDSLYDIMQVATLYAYNDPNNYKEMLELFGEENKKEFIEMYDKNFRSYFDPYAIYSDEFSYVFSDRFANVRTSVGELNRDILRRIIYDLKKNNTKDIKQYLKIKQEKPRFNPEYENNN